MFIVIETCEDYEQVLALVRGYNYPEGGILVWSDDAKAKRTVFESRRDARAAIDRTHHYAKAFGCGDLPEKRFCAIRPVAVELRGEGE